MSSYNENEDFEVPDDLDESLFEDPEDFVDDISDEDLLPEFLRERPELDLNTDTIIVVDNAPKVNPERLIKLQGVLNRIFSKFGNILNQYHPVDDKQITKGYFFMEFATRPEAEESVRAGTGYVLDKSHIFTVNHFSDFDTYWEVPEQWQPPEKEEYKETGNLKSWLLDPDCNDQFVVIHAAGEKTAVAYNTPKGPRPEIERGGWTDTDVRWSPKGTYLGTFHHGKGIALWGCSSFKRVLRVLHPGASTLDFSPCERYVVTSSNDGGENVIFTHCKTGAKMRGFSWEDSNEWPPVKWSPDGKYFARRSKDLLRVYETPSFGLLGKESFVLKGIQAFQWSPVDNIIAYWVPEQGAIPAKVALLEIPSRQEIRSKNLFQVSECSLQWHKQGVFLCVRVNRWATKSKKNLTYNLEVFHMRGQDIPLDTIEMKEPVIHYQLEPHGNRLAILHGIAPRIKLSLYNISHAKESLIELIVSLPTKPVSDIVWSPMGQFFILAGLKNSTDGTIEFYDAGDGSSSPSPAAAAAAVTQMSSMEHGDMSELEWDPTGRYVTSLVSFWSKKRDTGFIVWGFQGQLLYKQPAQMDKVCRFLWRPRPPTLLSAEDILKIKRDYKVFHRKFDAEDKITHLKASQELIEKRSHLMKDFRDFRRKCEHLYKDMLKKFPEFEDDQERTGEVDLEEITVLISEDSHLLEE